MTRPGFTLLELTVAITIGATAALVGFVGLAQLRDALAMAQAAEQAAAAAAARSTLVAWISSARVGGEIQATFSGVSQAAEGRSEDRLTFLASSTSPYHRSATWVTLRLDDAVPGEDRLLIAELVAWGDSVATRVPIAPAAGLTIRYLFGSGEDGRWLHGFSSAVDVPAAVEIAVDPVETTHRFFRLPILVPLRDR